jgi:hypothetical protein
MSGHVDGETNRCEALRMTKIAFAALCPAVLLAGCVQVKAPDKPIEINLNVNIKQEVVVRLEKDVQDLIKSNPGVF